ncbi:MAG: hypothetical protein KDK72_05095, partial [Chlamydiia bacterium]|nr:hypothetical protein [Chlamydiia bacterium]
IAFNIVRYVSTKKRLFIGGRLFAGEPWLGAYCLEKSASSNLAVVSFLFFGLNVSYTHIDDDRIGVAAVRKF